MEEEERKMHEKLGKSLFNRTWDLMDKKNRTIEEDFEMVHSAHTSTYHWSQIGEPVNFQRGEWQVSRVYAILKHPEACLFHAQRCLDLTEKYGLKDFDLAFGYEAMARAYWIAGKDQMKEEFIKKAKDAAELIKEEEDKEYFLSELATIH